MCVCMDVQNNFCICEAPRISYTHTYSCKGTKCYDASCMKAQVGGMAVVVGPGFPPSYGAVIRKQFVVGCILLFWIF